MSPCLKNQRTMCESLSPFMHDPSLDIISFSPANADIPLDQVQCRIVNHVRVISEPAALAPAITKAVRCRPGRRVVIDLIAHATSTERVLRFGSWEMRADRALLATFAVLTPLADRIAKIRLIGCQTGNSAAAYAALQGIHEAMGRQVEVYGTISDVNVNSFSDSQYTSGFLQSATRPPMAPPSAEDEKPIEQHFTGDIRQLFGSASALPRASGVESKLDDLLACVEEKSAKTSPGLLLQPSWSGTHAQLPVDLFEDRGHLRIWKPDLRESVIFEVRDPSRLKQVLGTFTEAPSAPSLAITG